MISRTGRKAGDMWITDATRAVRCGRIDPRKRLAWPASLQLSLVLAAPAFLTGAAQGFGERSAAGGLSRLARRRGCHRRAGIVARHAFAPATGFVIQTQR